MNLLRLVFKLDPKSAKKIMQKINYDDKRISNYYQILENKKLKLKKKFKKFLITKKLIILF
tara:strand:+ start:114 stop:296 length:183 start_codon:yes stop_codon:yes gene_type:complete